MRLGIDVGGTNTDAVILNEHDQVVAKTKQPTTDDVTSGILNALDAVLEQDGVEPQAIDWVMLGTTHATNAVAERKGLTQVAAIRIGAPATLAVPPLTEWPDDLRKAIGARAYVIGGGNEFDGREIGPLDDERLRGILTDLKGEIDAVALTAVFSPVRTEHEERAAAIAREILGDDFPVSVSHEIGSIGLLERENATVLNAALTRVARKAVSAFQEAMRERHIDAPLFLGQNDGTLMSIDYALQYPIFTIASGPANSIRGAAYLSKLEDGIIIDVGGTTSDIGVISQGFPRQSAMAVEVGEVRTNFRMPDLIALALGGGTIVRRKDGAVTVGPDSVGYRLTKEALIFGGDTTTASDVAVASGRLKLGTTVPRLSAEEVEGAHKRMAEIMAHAVERMKSNREAVPVIAVGGGSFLVPDELPGVSEVIRPQHFEVVNAIGAAIAQVSGEVDRIFSLDEMTRDEAVATARREAMENAVAAGADSTGVEVVDFDEIPLSYLPGGAVRMRAKAVGPLQGGRK